MSSIVASTPTKRKRDENDPPGQEASDGVALAPSRIPRLSAAPTPAKKGRVSVADSLRTPLANKTNTSLAAQHKLASDLKTPQAKAAAGTALKTPQTRIAKPAAVAASAVSARTGIKAPAAKARPSLRPVPKPDLTAQTPQSKGAPSAENGPINKENLTAPGPVSALIEQAGFEDRMKMLEEEFARKNKEAEELWNKKAEELQKQMELAKEQHDGAVKAQFEMASLLTSQREKYEDTINKLCNELGEAKAKLAQFSSEQAKSTAAAVAEAEEKLRIELEKTYMATLKGLEETLTEVQGFMEIQLQESKRNEAAAVAAQEALKVQMAELQASYESSQKAQADAVAASDLQAQHHSEEWAEKLAQQEQEWKSKLNELQRELEGLKEKEATVSTQNHELEALLASQSVQMGSYDMEKEALLKERAQAEEELARVREEFLTKTKEQEALWAAKLEECTKQLEEVKQQEQEARSAQREITLLLSAQEENHEGLLLRIQEELTQARARLRVLEEEQQNGAKEKMDLETALEEMRTLHTDTQKKLDDKEQEWAAKLEGMREQMDIEKQQSLAEQEGHHAAVMLEKETEWTGKLEAVRQELEAARQSEQEAFATQRELATLLSKAQEKHELAMQHLEQEWTVKYEELRRQLEAAQSAEAAVRAEEKAKQDALIAGMKEEADELRRTLAAEREERRRQAESGRRAEEDVSGWLAETKSILASGLERHLRDRTLYLVPKSS